MALTGTRTFVAVKEQSLLRLNGVSKGTSLENHLPIGRNYEAGDLEGGLFRGLIKFGVDFSQVSSITSATLTFRLSTQVHINPYGAGGDTCTLRVYRVTAPWTSTGGNQHTTQTQKTTSWLQSANETYDTFDYPDDVDNTTYASDGWFGDNLPINYQYLQFDVLDMVNEWFGGADNRGFLVKAETEGTVGSGDYHALELHGMRGQYPPTLTIEYTYDPTPDAAVLVTPDGSTTGTAPSTFEVAWNGDATIAAYDLQVGTTVGGSDLWSVSNSSTGLSANAVSRAYGGSAIPHGQTIYWRARGKNTIGDWGAWSSGTFYVYAAPDTPTFVSPTSGAPYAYVHNLNDLSVWSANEAKPRITLGYTHPDGIASTSWQIDVGGTVTTHAVAVESGSSYSFDVSTTVARATNVSVSARSQSLDGQWSSWTTPFNMKVNWAQGVYSYVHGAGANGLSFSNSALTGGEKARVEFAFRKSNGSPGPWVRRVSDVDPGTTLEVLARLSTTSASQNPALPDMTLTYTTATAPAPDHWVVSGATLSQSSERSYFGSVSSKVLPSATSGYLRATSSATQPVTVTLGRAYTFSAYINTKDGALSGSGVVGLRIKDGAGNVMYTGATTTSNTSSEPGGWERLSMTFTPTQSQVYPEVWFTNSGTYDAFYVDCAMLEEGSRASGWKPGHLGRGATVDVGGVQVDGTYGSVFRLRGSSGGLLDIVSLGLKGLKFGDTEVYGSASGVVTVGGALVTSGGITAGGNTSVTGTLSSTGLLSGGSISTSGTAATGALTVTGAATVSTTLGVTGDATVGSLSTSGTAATGNLTVTGTANVSGVLTVGNPAPIIRTYSSVGANTWTKPAGVALIFVELYGGGGGGGGCANPAAATEAAAGVGGAGGGYAAKYFTAADLAGASSFTVTVGGGGNGGTAGNNAGAAGTATTFSGTGITTVSASGGPGGAGGAVLANVDGTTVGTTGAASSGGDHNLFGEPSPAMRIIAGGKVTSASGGGKGGGPQGGSGGKPNYNAAANGGRPTGGGGGGANQSGTGTAKAGGAGGAGYAIITEFYLP